VSEQRITIYQCPRCWGRVIGDPIHTLQGGASCYCKTNKGDPTKCEATEYVLAESYERLEAERQAIIDVVNLYGDPILHKALDNAGLLRVEPGKGSTRP
jgi:hypothetical protein